MGQDELVRTFYESAREELIERIKLRDNSLYLYLAGVGAMVGALLASDEPRTEILLLIPFFSLAICFLTSQHHEVIGSIRAYCEDLIYRIEADPLILPWDCSAAFDSHRKAFITERTWAHSILTLGSSLASLAINWLHLNGTFPFTILWWAGLVCAVLSFRAIYRAHNWRENPYRQSEMKRIAIKKPT